MGVAEYDMFRYRAWRSRTVLDDFIKNQPFTKDSKLLVSKLKVAADDLLNAAEEISSRGLGTAGWYTDDGKFDQFEK